ncbi:TPA: lipid-A-disaccharide synthase [Legionella pneumophila]|uniref:lipid-A-disaccharide synthase n=1 Tax=Legionella pneumophila TaxID=446 RepID=UPI000D05FE6F|nr:lipid-A-disaccharide synthase [Legionella pneumophila]HAT2058792.1 lipid-A-disaccharide synthase [Legionella pneumophila]HAT8840430.1 lipid-A-disaccharide synthase [Legionella pneumophila subsp. pneumophila]HAU1202313.1 lipid-A-disaccharide synthase [Legionella pneumophila]HAU1875555.1 lipid-A-disaccharide synthase [Legionella pneumophila]HAU3846953.1 lipid-A-disaccharide synthase [Legionella pneumophila]
MIKKRQTRIAMIAGEMSGDLLGAGVIRELKKHLKNVEFIGVGGPQMLEEGFQSLANMSELSVMGISDVLRRYPQLYFIRERLLKEWTINPPDVFIGIDYPDFNLSVETRLKRQNVKTVHLVSPKVWAWRQKRVYLIKKAVDLVLTLFPFEESFYQQYDVPAQFVGHPLADLIEINPNNASLRKKYNYKPDDSILAVLPGSRIGEIKYMGPLFLEVMQRIAVEMPHVHFIVPIACQELYPVFFQQFQARYNHLKIQIIQGNAREAMAISDVVLTKSGTATLEAMLLKRPMVVAFKWSKFTHAIIAPQVKIPYVALPNLLANKKLVPEFVQEKATANSITESVLNLLACPSQSNLNKQFTAIHHTLRQNANEKAALSILKILETSSA